MHESNKTTAPGRDILGEILCDGAQRLLGQGIDIEVADWIEGHAGLTDGHDRRQVVRNGRHPARPPDRSTLLQPSASVVSRASLRPWSLRPAPAPYRSIWPHCSP